MRKAAVASVPQDGRNTRSVTLRVQTQKLRALDELARRTGVLRSAHIQLAIAQYLERNGGGSQ